MSKYETNKPSGIDWIGDVPEHWEVNRLKNLATGVSSKLTKRVGVNQDKDRARSVGGEVFEYCHRIA